MCLPWGRVLQVFNLCKQLVNNLIILTINDDGVFATILHNYIIILQVIQRREWTIGNSLVPNFSNFSNFINFGNFSNFSNFINFGNFGNFGNFINFGNLGNKDDVFL